MSEIALPASPTSRIRRMEPRDEAGLVALFHEMQAHYRTPCQPNATILSDLHSLSAEVTILVALDPKVVGVATLCVVYPGPGLRLGLFMKDLFVSAPRRGGGIGSALFRAAAEFALARGYPRLEWTADRDDEQLLALYRRAGAVGQRERVSGRSGCSG